jgi:hypothetical protein
MIAIAPPGSLVHLLKPWADYYSHSKTAVTVVTFLHIGGLLLAGGLAIAADRTSLRAMRRPITERSAQMKELASVHGWVTIGLIIVIVSGLAMLAADIETFFGSWIFWTKMALVAVLLINGLAMIRVEGGLEVDASESSPHWRTLEHTSIASLVLWFTITFAGLALANFS